MRELNSRIKKIEQLQKNLGGNKEIIIILVNNDGMYFKDDTPSKVFTTHEELKTYYKAIKPNKEFIFIIDLW